MEAQWLIRRNFCKGSVNAARFWHAMSGRVCSTNYSRQGCYLYKLGIKMAGSLYSDLSTSNEMCSSTTYCVNL